MTLASLGVTLDVAPARAAAAALRADLAATGQSATKFAGDMAAASAKAAEGAKQVGEAKGFEQAGQSAQRGAADVARSAGTMDAGAKKTQGAFAAMADRARGAWNSVAETTSGALGRVWEWIQKVAGGLASSLDNGFTKATGHVAAFAAEISLLARGLGLLSIPVLGAGAAFGTLGTIVASGSLLWFNYSKAAAGARGSLQELLKAAGLTNVGLTTTRAALGSMGLTIGGVITGVLSLVAAYKLLKLAKESSDLAAGREKQEVLFGQRTGDLNDTQERVREVARIGITLPGTDTDTVLKGAAQIEKITSGALKIEESLEMVSGAALAAEKPFDEMAGKVANLFELLRKGEDAEELIREFQKMGIFSDEARDRIAALQQESKKGPEVWKVAADALNAYGVVLDERRGTFAFASESLSRAWTELKTELGRPISDALTPVLKGLADFVRGYAIPALDDVATAIRQVVQEIRDLPQDVVNFINFIRNGGVRLDNLPTDNRPIPGAIASNPSDPRVLPKVNPKPKDDDDKDKKGGGRVAAAQTYETDAALVKRYREEIEFLEKAMAKGDVTSGEFIYRQTELQKRLANSLGDPQKYAEDVGAFRAAQAEKLRVIEAMKENIEEGTASFSDIVRYTLTKTSEEWGKFTKQVGDVGNKVLNSFADGLSSAFASMITGAKSASEAFRDFASSFITDVVKMISKILILWALQKAIGFITNDPKSASVTIGDTARGVAGIRHAGGLVGEPGPTRDIFVPRYHGGGILGLASDERLIVGRKDEGVFTPAQMRALAPVSQLGGGRGGDIITIHQTIHRDGSATTETEATDARKAAALGRAIRAAVQQEIANQRRAGGLLA